MPSELYTTLTMSVTDLKRNPMVVAESNEPIAVLNRNTPVFYCVPADTYHQMVDALENAQDSQTIEARKDSKRIRINNIKDL